MMKNDWKQEHIFVNKHTYLMNIYVKYYFFLKEHA